MAVWNIAHRGGAGLYPENSLAAFGDAVARGCDGAELDVQLSRDGDVIVFHDYRLKPEICRLDGAWITPPTPRIKDMSLAELQAYDIGRADPASDYAAAHGRVTGVDGQRIPTLDAVLDIAKTAAKPFKLFVELKTSFGERERSADPVELAQATIAVLKRHDYLDHTIMVGFDWPGLLHVKKIADVECWFTTMAQSWFGDAPPPPEDDPPAEPALAMMRHWANTGTSPWAGGYDAVKYGGSIIRAIAAAGGAGWFPPSRDLTAASVAEARDAGLKLGAWTVDDPDEMRRLIALGVDAICTDVPDVLAGIVEEDAP